MTKELYTALAKAHGEFKPVEKNGKANYGTFADLDDLKKATREALVKHGLSVIQGVDEENRMVTILAHSSGESISFKTKIIVEKTTPQGFGIASTYFRRYGYQSILNIVGEDDTDGNLPNKPAQPAVRSFENKLSGEYIIQVGKYKGQPITSISPDDIRNYYNYILKTANESGKPINGPMAEFMKEAEAYIGDKT